MSDGVAALQTGPILAPHDIDACRPLAKENSLT